MAMRPASLVATLAFALVVGGSFWLTRRNPGIPPQEEAFVPFRSAVAGAGQLLELQPPPAPLRSVRWTGPLPGGSAVAQILTQTGRQQATLIMDGRPEASATLECPPGVPEAFFRFADLSHAAVVPGRIALLLFRDANGGEMPLVLAWDLASNQASWFHRAPGHRLTLSADQGSAFLFGSDQSVTIFPLTRGPGSGGSPITVDLPPDTGAIADLLPLGPRAFLLAHHSGLSSWLDGTWHRTARPAPSLLGFPTGLERLVRAPKGPWWQPEPGLLLPLDRQGQPGAPVDLRALLPDGSGHDAAMLQLLGATSDGQLWFALAPPTLPPAAPPPAPTLMEDPSQAEPAPPMAAPPAPESPASLDPVEREAWEAHLRKGLDRIYRWKPGSRAMQPMAWTALWKQAAPPPGILPPTRPADLQPEAGGLLLGTPERMWWVPLASLQPR